MSEYWADVFGRRSNGRTIHQATYDAADRATQFDLAAPNCTCEAHRVSEYSPCRVDADELIVRMVFFPDHIHKTKGSVKPNFFDYVFSRGCSVQRHDRAAPSELSAVVGNFLSGDVKEKRAWLGVVAAPVGALRGLTTLSPSGGKALCVYDTAEKDNPAHAEIVATKDGMDEANKLEVMRHIVQAFGNGAIQAREAYFDGKVWSNIEPKLQRRAIPETVDMANMSH